MTVTVAEQEAVIRIKLTYRNPLTDKIDFVLVRKSDLDLLRAKESSGIVIVSYFHSMRAKRRLFKLVNKSSNMFVQKFDV